METFLSKIDLQEVKIPIGEIPLDTSLTEFEILLYFCFRIFTRIRGLLRTVSSYRLRISSPFFFCGVGNNFNNHFIVQDRVILQLICLPHIYRSFNLFLCKDYVYVTPWSRSVCLCICWCDDTAIHLPNSFCLIAAFWLIMNTFAFRVIGRMVLNYFLS